MDLFLYIRTTLQYSVVCRDVSLTKSKAYDFSLTLLGYQVYRGVGLAVMLLAWEAQ